MDIKFETSDFEKGLDRLGRNAKNISGENEVPFDELFNSTFLLKYSNHESIDDFFKNSNFDFSDMESIDELELDDYVSANSSFGSWEQMKVKASEQWVIRQLGI